MWHKAAAQNCRVGRAFLIAWLSSHRATSQASLPQRHALRSYKRKEGFAQNSAPEQGRGAELRGASKEGAERPPAASGNSSWTGSRAAGPGFPLGKRPLSSALGFFPAGRLLQSAAGTKRPRGLLGVWAGSGACGPAGGREGTKRGKPLTTRRRRLRPPRAAGPGSAPAPPTASWWAPGGRNPSWGSSWCAAPARQQRAPRPGCCEGLGLDTSLRERGLDVAPAPLSPPPSCPCSPFTPRGGRCSRRP